MTNTAIGLIYNNRKQYDSAIFYHQVVMEIAKKEKDSTWFGIASGNLGTIYLNQYQYNKAIPFFEADVRLSTRAKEWSSSAGSLIRLSKIRVIQNNLTLALTQLQAADTMLAKIKNIILNAKLYEEYATLYERLKDLKKALYYQKKWLSAKDSAGIIYNSKILSDIKLKIALETNIYKTKDLELAQKLRSSVVIQRLLYVIIIFVYIAYRLKYQGFQNLFVKYVYSK